MNCRTCAGPCCLKGSHIEGDCEGYKPMSHYEQIKAMSVEEMADYFRNHASMCPDLEENETVCKGANFTANDEMCQKCWLDWLRQEAEHE